MTHSFRALMELLLTASPLGLKFMEEDTTEKTDSMVSYIYIIILPESWVSHSPAELQHRGSQTIAPLRHSSYSTCMYILSSVRTVRRRIQASGAIAHQRRFTRALTDWEACKLAQCCSHVCFTYVVYEGNKFAMDANSIHSRSGKPTPRNGNRKPWTTSHTMTPQRTTMRQRFVRQLHILSTITPQSTFENWMALF